jgi:hypothetical protein
MRTDEEKATKTLCRDVNRWTKRVKVVIGIEASQY